MIFPDWGESPAIRAEEAELPLFTEWAVDWDEKRFAGRDGRFYTVTGTEALKIWVYRALRKESERFRYTAWSWDHGNELETLLGGCADRGVLESRLRQYIREALLVSPYIRAADGFSFRQTGTLMEVSAALGAYLRERALRTRTVSCAQVLRLLLDCPGTADVTVFALGGAEESLTLPERAVPVGGTLELEEAET